MSELSFRQADLPGIRPLYADLLFNFECVRRFYPRPPSLDAACAAADAVADDVRMDGRHRQRLADELGRQNEGVDGATLESIDRLSRPGTVAVVTGQQVGLLGGPAFTLYKALTAVRCARELSHRGRPAVPVFWLATEDHDLAEVNHAWVFGPDGSPRRIDAVTDAEPAAAVGGIRVADAGLDLLQAVCDGLPYAPGALALARQAYGQGPGFGAGFRALYREILSGTGIVLVCPMSAGLRELCAPVVRRAIELAPELSAALLRRGARLQGAGYHQQVRFQESTSLIFLFEGSERVALKRRNGFFWARSQAYSREDLLARLDRAPLEVSPNALLRPVMQDFLLPTAALVAGPSEAAYYAQSAVLYERLLGRMPTVLPRASFTVLDAAARKLLRRYRLSVADCLVPRNQLLSSVATTLVPAPLSESLSARRAEVLAALQGIDSALVGFDPTLAASFEVSRNKIEYQLDKVAAKVSREALRRTDAARRHAAVLADTVYPNGSMQERLYSVLPFLAKFGPSFVSRVERAVEPGSSDHTVLEF